MKRYKLLSLICGVALVLDAGAKGWAQVSAGIVNYEKVALLKWYPANQTTSFPVGEFPYGLAFDGANVWVANSGSATVSKLRAADGANLGSFSVGLEPIALAFDGANVWVANEFDNTVSKLRAADGATLGTFP